MNLLIITQKVDKNDDILGFFHRWIIEFAKHVEYLTVICLYEGKHDLPQNVKVLSLGKETGESRLKYLIRFYKYIWQERKNYDSVFVHMNQIYVILGSIVWKILGKNVSLWYAHGHVPMSLRAATLLTDKIFTSTQSGFRINTRKKCVVGQGIDTELFKPTEKEEDSNNIRIISVGRISPVKNYETLIEAVERLSGVSNLEVWIIGAPGNESQKIYLQRLKELVETKSLKEKIKFLGSKTQLEVAELLKQADIFVNTSNTGSLDKAILEAMAVGLSVLTSNEAVKELHLPEIYIKKEEFIQKFPDKLRIVIQRENRINIKNRDFLLKNHSIENLVFKMITKINVNR